VNSHGKGQKHVSFHKTKWYSNIWAGIHSMEMLLPVNMIFPRKT